MEEKEKKLEEICAFYEAAKDEKYSGHTDTYLMCQGCDGYNSKCVYYMTTQDYRRSRFIDKIKQKNEVILYENKN